MSKGKQDLMSVREIQDYIESLGAKRPSSGTVSNWFNKGVDGVILPTSLRSGVQRYSTREAVDNFINRH